MLGRLVLLGMMRGGVLAVLAMVFRFGTGRHGKNRHHDKSKPNHKTLRAEILHLGPLRNNDPQETQPSYHLQILWWVNLGSKRPKGNSERQQTRTQFENNKEKKPWR